MIGKELGRYRVIEALGEGGMAVVYKAFDHRLNRQVAIKVIQHGFEGRDLHQALQTGGPCRGAAQRQPRHGCLRRLVAVN